MELEEATKRTFKNQQDKTYNNLVFTNNWLDGQYKNFFSRFDISQQQYQGMKVLQTHYPTPGKAIVVHKMLIVKPPDTSRIIERLRLKGFVDRQWKEADRRSVDIVL